MHLHGTLQRKRISVGQVFVVYRLNATLGAKDYVEKTFTRRM